MLARTAVAAVATLAVLSAQGALAATPAPPPTELAGILEEGRATLSWSPPGEGDGWAYQVYREGELLAKTTDLAFLHAPPEDTMNIYLVNAASPEYGWGEPALLALPGPGCEIVTVIASWNYPYLHVHVHEECLDGTGYDRDLSWTLEEERA